MSLSDLASIGSLVSGVAVFASLVYLGLQTHQASKHTRALIQQGRAARVTETLNAFSDTDRATAFQTALGRPSTPEGVRELQALMFFSATVMGWVDVFEQYQMGLQSNDHLADVRVTVRFLLTGPLFRRAWEQWKVARPNSHAAFKAWVDEAASEMPAAPGGV